MGYSAQGQPAALSQLPQYPGQQSQVGTGLGAQTSYQGDRSRDWGASSSNSPNKGDQYQAPGRGYNEDRGRQSRWSNNETDNDGNAGYRSHSPRDRNGSSRDRRGASPDRSRDSHRTRDDRKVTNVWNQSSGPYENSMSQSYQNRDSDASNTQKLQNYSNSSVENSRNGRGNNWGNRNVSASYETQATSQSSSNYRGNTFGNDFRASNRWDYPSTSADQSQNPNRRVSSPNSYEDKNRGFGNRVANDNKYQPSNRGPQTSYEYQSPLDTSWDDPRSSRYGKKSKTQPPKSKNYQNEGQAPKWKKGASQAQDTFSPRNLNTFENKPKPNFTLNSSEPPVVNSADKQSSTARLIRRDSTYQLQVTARLVKEMLNANEDIQADSEKIVKAIKRAVRTRLEILLASQLGLSQDEMVETYRAMFPVNLDKDFCLAVVKKVKYEEEHPQNPGNAMYGRLQVKLDDWGTCALGARTILV